MHKQNRKPCKAIEGLTKYNKAFKDAVKPCLINNSENHCAYCDEHFFNSGNLVIEHFKGRTKFPKLETHYPNLYAACNSCNSRKRDENYPKIEPLRPDDKDYNFDDNFYLDAETGELISLTDIAKITRDFLNLNNQDIKKARKDFCSEWLKKRERPSKSYRFIELGTRPI